MAEPSGRRRHADRVDRRGGVEFVAARAHSRPRKRASTVCGPRGPPSGAGAGVPDPLDLRAKTAIPPVRAGTVPRPGLVNRLRAANGHRLVTLVAPAGYGKTTLLSQWAERDARRFAWVALDGGDDASTLFECVIGRPEPE